MSVIQHREHLKSVYSNTEVSDTYIQNRFYSGTGKLLHEAQVKFVVHAISRFKIENVLEIAPGPARLTVDIGTACRETRGTIMDVNENMLEQAEKRLTEYGLSGRWRTVAGDAFALPFDDIFQLVYSFRFIRHFHEEDRAKIYRQIFDHLEPQGYLIFDAINRDVSATLRDKAGPGAYPIYDELYNFAQLKEELKINGFKVIDHIPVQYSFSLQNLIQIWIAPRSKGLAYFMMKMIESARIGQPLEWVALCQKM